MLAMSDRLPFDEDEEPTTPTVPVPLSQLPDRDARRRAVDPAHNVVLEASAGTGKTHVLVERYLNLLRHGVEPANILAITFTRKAAAEMRVRILRELRKRADSRSEDQQLWRDMRERSADIALSTIDAFCLSLLHEFPLEANLDPGFELADETQTPRLMEEALDRALDIGRGLARTDDYVRLLFAELREWRIREGLGTMIDKRLVVEDALERALQSGPRDLTAELACERAFERIRNIFAGLSGGVEGFLANGPVQHRRWALFAGDMRLLASGAMPATGLARGVLDRLEAHFLNKDGEPRQRWDGYSAQDCASPAMWRTHRADIQRVGVEVADALKGFRRDLNAVLSRGVRRIYQIALTEYHRALDSHGVLDFSETLARALALLAQMDEFARSRYRLEGRYHHVLVDEFQDTSRAQWTLVALLIRSWGEGIGVAESAPLVPSIFLVGDRKQSIYGFRDADVAVMDDAGAFVDELRRDRDSRRSISKSFRAVPELLAFANDLFQEVEKDPSRRDAFRFDERDRFPLDESPLPGSDGLGIVAAPTVTDCAEIVSAEIGRLIEEHVAAPRDIGILFRTKEGHQEFERALQRRQIASYVYKGLGFFEADEIKDVLALLRFLASPDSNLRAAAFLRSRLIRLSDRALQALAPDLARALAGPRPPNLAALEKEDRLVLGRAREGVARWLSLVDRVPPAELLEMVLEETAYLFETRGPRARQARENLKKIRAMIRRVQNRGYLTLSRLAEHLERLTAGDESNAVIDAGDAVSLMTIHAAKGLEFPVVFVVNLSKGTGGRRSPIRVVSDADGGQAWLSVSDFQSEADRDAKAKDREETKRLLYVALTRARQRLYLASEAKDGRFKPWAGSLGDVLPASFRPKFDAAAMIPPPETVEWIAASGRVHTLHVCRLPDESWQTPVASIVAKDGVAAPDDFSRLLDPCALPRIAVTAATVKPATARAATYTEQSSHSLAGTLVHRLFDRSGTSLGSEDSRRVTEELQRLMKDEEFAEVEDLDRLLKRASQAYRALCAQPALTVALESGNALFEVPFSVREANAQTILRGTFDCLIQRPDGGVVVLELKTGKPMPEHQQQLDTYLNAARALFPGTPVEGELIYAGLAGLDDRTLDANL
jgi:ATP-dependent helicase/nuclease subunit A